MWLRYHNFFVFIFSFVGYLALALALANFKGKESIEGIEGREAKAEGSGSLILRGALKIC